jgi:hypothetical protein
MAEVAAAEGVAAADFAASSRSAYTDFARQPLAQKAMEMIKHAR